MQSDNETKQDIPFLVRAIRKLIWLLRMAKHHLYLFAKRIIKAIVYVFYEKTHIKYLHQLIRLKKLLKETYGYELQEKQSKISVALILRDGKTYPKSSAFIRLISPLCNLTKSGSVSFKIFNHDTTTLPDGINICIVQRTAYKDKDTAKKLVDNINKRNIKLIVDTDDAFNLIDNSHSEYLIHDEGHLALEFLIKNSEQVWVSTPALAKGYEEISSSVYIVANTLDRRLWAKKYRAPVSRGPLRMVYMGTATHDGDFNMILESLDKLAIKYPGMFELSVIGVSCKELPERPWIKRLYQPNGGAIYPKFVEWFVKQGPFDIGLCPLIESPFNNYKSDIKCLDYIGANILPIASNVPAYSTKGLDKYVIRIDNNPNLWVNRLGKALDNLDGFRKESKNTLAEAKAYLWGKRSSEIASHSILKLLNKALKE